MQASQRAFRLLCLCLRQCEAATFKRTLQICKALTTETINIKQWLVAAFKQFQDLTDFIDIGLGER
jgi:hypothetical protein